MTGFIRTIADIAKLAGVSKSTVSRALNNSPLISQDTRERIQAIAREHRFATHQGARCLSLQRSDTIGLILPLYGGCVTHSFITDPFFVEVLRGITLTLGEYRHDLLIGQPAKDAPGEVQRYLESKRADGLILLGCQGYLEAISNLFGPDAPIIVWGADNDLIYCNVNSDNVAGGRLAAQHLLEIGRKRIAFLGGYQGEPEVKLRQQGYAEALQKGGVEVNPVLINYGDYTSEAGYAQMRDLLEQVPDIDGVFACSDLMAIGAMEAIRERGRRVPDDVAVVGFDDIQLAAYCSPPLTTVRQNLLKAGEALVRNLMQYLQDGIITRTILPVELVVRKSTQK
jgi:DNA-binding LacI/PurR family transcriptional regulator